MSWWADKPIDCIYIYKTRINLIKTILSITNEINIWMKWPDD